MAESYDNLTINRKIFCKLGPKTTDVRTSVMKKLSAGGSSRGCWTEDWVLPVTCAELGRALGRLLMPPMTSAALSVRELLLCIGGSGEHLTSELLPTDADCDLWPDLLTVGLADVGGAASMARSRSSTLQRGTEGIELDTYNIPWPYYFTLLRGQWLWRVTSLASGVDQQRKKG